MKITKTSALSGIEHTMDIPCTKQQLGRYYTGINLVQDVFPELNSEQREFLITGITPDEWKKAIEDIKNIG